MRKLIVAEHISVDGVIQAPGNPEEDPSGGFRFGGWTVPFADEATGKDLEALMAQPFDLLLGRRTYDIFAGYWPRVPADSGSHSLSKRFNAVTKYVATHRPEALPWQNSHALQGDIAAAVRALKDKGSDNLLTWGSSEMVRQLLAAGLVDEMRLLVYPVMLGQGKRLFGDDAQPSSFSLAQSIRTPTGVLLNRYERGGEVRTGSYDDGVS